MRDSLLIDSFLEMMSAERGAAANTLSAYERDLSDYAEFLHTDGNALISADGTAIRNWIADMQKLKIAPSTQARKLSAIRQLYRFCYSEGLREDDPTGAIDSPKIGRPLPKIISESSKRCAISQSIINLSRISERLRHRCI